MKKTYPKLTSLVLVADYNGNMHYSSQVAAAANRESGIKSK